MKRVQVREIVSDTDFVSPIPGRARVAVQDSPAPKVVTAIPNSKVAGAIEKAGEGR